MKKRDEYDKILKDNSLFSALTNEQLSSVKREMRVVKIKGNQPIFDTETKADRFFVLVTGQIKLYRLFKNGTEKIIEIIRPGEVFASAVMFMEIDNYPVSADSLQDSCLLSFNNKQFLGILKESPETCLRMLANMSQRLRRQLTEIDKLYLKSAHKRLLNYLAEHMKIVDNNVGIVKLDSPKRVVASNLSIQPETFSRALKKLNEENLIAVDGRSIHIPDVAKLQFYVDE
ncbi:MAG: Crp/Fnr family transcriptional regulator [Magnetococcales bacterium]|nr:Crp/Fnr family transcriptional regulator [Magnetococcales bacterium]